MVISLYFRVIYRYSFSLFFFLSSPFFSESGLPTLNANAQSQYSLHHISSRSRKQSKQQLETEMEEEKKPAENQ